MKCVWDSLMSVLPPRLRKQVDTAPFQGVQELRLRRGQPPELVLPSEFRRISGAVNQDDLSYIVNSASQYSPWTAASSAEGYLTIRGGHRIGLCGEVLCTGGIVRGMKQLRSVCIRVARDFPGIAKDLAPKSSVLILGAPGWGKTTLLRDLIRQTAGTQTVAVVDSRGELFPPEFDSGCRTDILTGCPKGPGIDMLLRTMAPEWIAVDEITSEGDCEALLRAAGCGVRLMATAHAASLRDLSQRPVYAKLLKNRVFTHIVLLRGDKSYREEMIA